MATDATTAERRIIMVFPFECPVCGHKTNMPQTNADRIRSMSDEELAICLYEIGYDGGWGAPEGTLEWLQQPAEEADNG